MKTTTKIITFTILAVLASSSFTFAGTAAPWDSGLTSFIALFQGKLALGIFLIVGIGAAWKVISGGELDEWTRKILVGIIVVSSLIAITALFNILFGTSGALLQLTI